MIGVSKVISTTFDSARRLVVKVLFQGKLINGKGDVRTPVEASPFGVDSNPIEKKVAIYAQSPVKGQYYVIGYLNTERLAETGETRLFSTDADGNLQAYIWLRNTGEILELNGDDNFAVKYTELKAEYDKTKAYITALRNATGGLATVLDGIVPGTSAAFNAAMAGQVLGDFAQAKNDKIKTNS